tara:strand:+ start:774 stop:1061 length:288 start_codon:yes stop_codon:yes gene_type:complete
MKQAITTFLSSRGNLTIFQCLLYGVVGYVMGQHLTWIQLGGMLAVMYLIQFITRTKAVADGMMFRQIMIENDMKASEFLQLMKEETDKINKDKPN